MRIRRPTGRRAGATTVEFAVVAVLLFMLLFGILEYARFLYVYHITQNAARDAARFAAVHTGGGTMAGEPVAITTADVQEVVRSGLFNGKACGTGMCGAEGQITGYTVDVYSVTNTQLSATPPDVDPAGKPAWTSAAFQDKVVVRVSGTYQPVVPSLIGLGSTINFQVTALCSSEGN